MINGSGGENNDFYDRSNVEPPPFPPEIIPRPHDELAFQYHERIKEKAFTLRRKEARAENESKHYQRIKEKAFTLRRMEARAGKEFKSYGRLLGNKGSQNQEKSRIYGCRLFGSKQ